MGELCPSSMGRCAVRTSESRERRTRYSLGSTSVCGTSAAAAAKSVQQTALRASSRQGRSGIPDSPRVRLAWAAHSTRQLAQNSRRTAGGMVCVTGRTVGVLARRTAASCGQRRDAVQGSDSPACTRPNLPHASSMQRSGVHGAPRPTVRRVQAAARKLRSQSLWCRSTTHAVAQVRRLVHLGRYDSRTRRGE